MGGKAEEDVGEETAFVETSTSGEDVDSISKAKEEDVTIDEVEMADGVDGPKFAAVIAVDTTITFVEDEGFADAKDGFAVADLQSPKPV